MEHFFISGTTSPQEPVILCQINSSIFPHIIPTVIFNLVVSINNNLNSNNNNDNQNNLNAVSQSTNNLVTNTNAVNKISVTLLPSPGKRSVDQMIECQSLQGRRAAEEILALYLFQVYSLYSKYSDLYFQNANFRILLRCRIYAKISRKF